MRKLLSLFVVMSMLASTGYSFVPLSNTQNNLGSYQNSATQGMFYNELDIISAYPVELLDFSGNHLYTSWSNARNYATSNANYPTALNWSSNLNNANLSWLQLGVSGDPLSMFNINDSRAALFFQNYGSKTNTFNFDGAGINDSEYQRENVTNSATSATDVTPMRVQTESTDVKYYSNNTYNQWNAGIAKKELFLDGLSLGFSISNITNSNVLNSGGTKSFTDRYLTDAGAALNAMPAGSREGDTYSTKYTENTIDQNSTSITDILAQGRYGLSRDLILTAALGLRYNIQPIPAVF